MTVEQIIDRTRQAGVKLVIIDGRLKAAPPGRLPPELKAAIRERAGEVKAALLPESSRPARSILETCRKHRRCRCGYHVYDPERIYCPACSLELPRRAPAKADHAVPRTVQEERKHRARSVVEATFRPTCRSGLARAA